MKKRTYGTGSVRPKASGRFELRYRVPGEKAPRSEVIEAPSFKLAERELRKRLEMVETKKLGARILISALFDLYLNDQAKMGRAQTPIVALKVEKFLRPFFGHVDVYQLSPSSVDDYINQRFRAKARPAARTINHELSILQRVLNLAREKRVASVQISIDKLPGENVRQGFLEEVAYRAIRSHLPAHQVPFFTLGYYTGIRAGELLSLQWRFVDFTSATPLIKIPGDVTKNGKPRTVPIFHPEMMEALKQAFESRDPACPYIFQYRGKRLRDYREGWDAARIAAGYPEALFHDTRRTAIRNMERANVRRSDARQISGHRTESVYIRYDIANEQGAFEAAERLRKFHLEQASRKIVGNLWDDKARNDSGEGGPDEV